VRRTAPTTPHREAELLKLDGSPARLRKSMLISGAVHLLVIASLGYEIPRYVLATHAPLPLEITMFADAISNGRPEKADALADVDHIGGGTGHPHQKADVRPGEAPLAARETSPEPQPAVMPLSPERPSAPSRRSTAIQANAAQSTPRAVSLETAPSRPVVSADQILASRNQEIAQLTARIEDSARDYVMQPRRRAISASTREYKYANYLEEWRRKVERIGNLNYPEEAKRLGLHGSLILQVAIRADGTVASVRVVRSSGFNVLDKAAVRIVKLAAPYAPFPADIRAETDILDITRTWQFLSSNHLGWDD
jgi:periplasmic protein TonB